MITHQGVKYRYLGDSNWSQITKDIIYCIFFHVVTSSVQLWYFARIDRHYIKYIMDMLIDVATSLSYVCKISSFICFKMGNLLLQRFLCNIRKMNDMNGMEIYSDMLIDMVLDICNNFLPILKNTDWTDFCRENVLNPYLW